MKKIILISSAYLFVTFNISSGQDVDFDNSKISPLSMDDEYLLPLFSYSGIPQNHNNSDELIILINHGFAVGYSPAMNQPRWAAYSLSRVKEGVNYDRSQYFLDDLRLPAENQIGNESFGNGYDRGHMVPNGAINHLFGRLSQMETFLMSNICPQKSGLNRGMWADFEAKIREEYAQEPTSNNEPYQNLWIIVGPIFPSNPQFIDRKNDSRVAISEAFYAIVIDPYNYPYERPGNANFLALIFEQNVSQIENYSDDMIVTINEIEFRTELNFFPDFTDYYENKIESTKANDIW